MCPSHGVPSVAGVSVLDGAPVVFCVTPVVGVPAFNGEPFIFAPLLLLASLPSVSRALSVCKRAHIIVIY